MMALGQGICVYRDDIEGKDIKTFLDSLDDHIQALVLVEDDGYGFAIPPTTLDVAAGAGGIEIEQSDPDDLNLNANAQIGNTNITSGNPVPIEEDMLPPTDGNNPSYSLSYVGDEMTQVDKMIGATTYRRAFGYTDGLWTSASVWTVV